MEGRSKILEVLEKAIFYGWACSGKKWMEKPGSIISRMSPEDREVLKELSATDIVNVRTDHIC